MPIATKSSKYDISKERNTASIAKKLSRTVKKGNVFTPKPTGTFLAGITRYRVIKLLEDAKIKVIESKIKPEELFETVIFLASENAGYISGQSIPVDGGYDHLCYSLP